MTTTIGNIESTFYNLLIKFSNRFTCITPGAFRSHFCVLKFQYFIFTIITKPRPSQLDQEAITNSTSTKRFKLWLDHLVYFLIITKNNTSTCSFSNLRPYQNRFTSKFYHFTTRKLSNQLRMLHHLWLYNLTDIFVWISSSIWNFRYHNKNIIFIKNLKGCFQKINKHLVSVDRDYNLNYNLLEVFKYVSIY